MKRVETVGGRVTDNSELACIVGVGEAEYTRWGPVRLVTNIQASVDEITIGPPVSLFWDRVAGDMFLPLFKPVGKRWTASLTF